MFGTFLTFSKPDFDFVPGERNHGKLFILSFFLYIISVSAADHVCDLRSLIKPVLTISDYLWCDAKGILLCLQLLDSARSRSGMVKSVRAQLETTEAFFSLSRRSCLRRSREIHYFVWNRRWGKGGIILWSLNSETFCGFTVLLGRLDAGGACGWREYGP